uniref:phytoene/squalene synthase family protein n=1 Tax=Ningiella ruwaisensis TaxID=2364274 RepID=UPI001447B416|nr:phytoene/squalene synthase family protein [Ningiella ruwaisensis]
MTVQNTQKQALVALKQYGKTFNFAKLFLEKETGDDAAVLYRFCRIVDDIVDEKSCEKEAGLQLENIIKAIKMRDIHHEIAGPFLQLCSKHKIDPVYGLQLIKGVSKDLNSVAIESQDELIEYSYYVAGTVGLMMAPILRSQSDGYLFAIDLGIAMQLTNIARDVQEDAQTSRCYLPKPWIQNADCKDVFSTHPKTRKTFQNAISKTLGLAELYYNSGLKGLHFLPSKNRRAIGIAACLYRQIGRKLMNNNCEYWNGRTVVSPFEKTKLACLYLYNEITQEAPSEPSAHDARLHTALKSII